jgi:MOSC domain-containing protein YiiM
MSDSYDDGLRDTAVILGSTGHEDLGGDGELHAVWVKRMRRGPMDRADSAVIRAGSGIVGNANQGGQRQVTLMELEAWDGFMRRLGASLPTSARRANLVVRSIRLRNRRGHLLRIGVCRIRVFGETKPCERMDEPLSGLRRIMWANWGGGALGEVLDDGRISVGDPVSWIE